MPPKCLFYILIQNGKKVNSFKKRNTKCFYNNYSLSIINYRLLCTFGAKVPKRGGFDSPAPLNDNGFALDPFGGFFILQIKVCAVLQIQKLHAVVIHQLMVLTPKIIVQQRKLITMILPLFLDFLFVQNNVAQELNRRRVRDYSLLK